MTSTQWSGSLFTKKTKEPVKEATKPAAVVHVPKQHPKAAEKFSTKVGKNTSKKEKTKQEVVQAKKRGRPSKEEMQRRQEIAAKEDLEKILQRVVAAEPSEQSSSTEPNQSAGDDSKVKNYQQFISGDSVSVSYEWGLVREGIVVDHRPNSSFVCVDWKVHSEKAKKLISMIPAACLVLVKPGAIRKNALKKKE